MRVIHWFFWPLIVILALALCFIFVHANVSGWFGQPSSISILAPELLKVGVSQCVLLMNAQLYYPFQNTNIMQPTITVCPEYLDVASLIVNYFNSDLYKVRQLHFKYILEVITAFIQRETMFEGQLNSIMRKDYPHLLGRHFESIIYEFYPEPANHWGLSEAFFSACSLGNDRKVDHKLYVVTKLLSIAYYPTSVLYSIPATSFLMTSVLSPPSSQP